ncbi:MAG TPA: extracellular solute-binding protein [Thermoflexia bacterium]|nr:extracellular solute-binding protein [Thermoflexia bacterium]
MKKHGLWTIVAVVAVLSMLLIGCQPQTVTVTVEVPVKETVEVPVEKTVVQTVEVPVGGEVIHLVARCKASPPYENGRCENLLKAVGAANAALAEKGDDRRIELEIIQDDADWGDYKTEFELASEAGEAPDIICSGHEHIGDWATAGYLTDITDMIGDYPEFDDVIDSLWESTKLNDRIWGVPQDAEARPMYYSKILLKELGWSDEEIENLDDRVYAGEFTWQDMFDVAQEAVEKGIVQEGDGWWHRPSNGPDFLYYYYSAGGEIEEEGFDGLVFDKEAAFIVYDMLYDAAQVRHIIRPNKLDGDWDFHKEYTSRFDKVLFVFEGTWRWASWAVNYLQDVGGEDYLFANVGFAPIPANERGTKKPITLTHPLVYMISSQCEHPDLALLLISKATTKELNTDYAVASGHLGILKSQADYPPYITAKFLSATLPLLEYTTFLPNSPYWSTYSEAYYMGIQAVESGDLTPDEAVDAVTERLQNELGEHIKIIP